MDDHGRLAKEIADDPQLRSCIALDDQAPALRDDGQLILAPDLLAATSTGHVVGRVGVRLGLFQHVSETPGHPVGTAGDESLLAPTATELGGNRLRSGRFLCNEYAHIDSRA